MVDKCKFLGIIIDDKINWKPHILAITSTIARNLGVIRRIRQNIYSKTTLLLYDAMILPHLTYCNLILANCARSHLIKFYCLQKKAFRLVFLDDKYTHSASLFYKLCRLTLFDLNHFQLATFVYSCVNRFTVDIFSTYLVSNNTVHMHNTRLASYLHCNYARTILRKSSVYVSGPQ